MLRSLFSGVSGLRVHQVRMDVIGNNIANINTTGFKAGRVNFYEMLNQTIQGARAPSGGIGGTNPLQVGLGVTVGSIDTIFTQGNLQFTGRITDLGIQGDGFFVVSDGFRNYFTRDGALSVDSTGALVHSGTGMRVLGWMAGETGAIDVTGPLSRITIPIGAQMPPRATSEVAFSGNLDSRVETDEGEGADWTSTFTAFDSLGNAIKVTVTFTKTADNEWGWEATYNDESVGSGTLTFTETGTLAEATDTTISIDPGAGASPLEITLSFDRVTQLAAKSSVGLFGQDGYSTGTLETYSVDGSGVITGQYSNGRTQALGQVALAQFNNPAGLVKMGGNLFAESANSGTPLPGVAGTGGRGTLVSGALEMSNVDLGQEFTSMIIAQRGFQANSRVITTADEILQDLIALRR